jgi:mono/diheme cytochrome c family protein
MIKSPLRIPGIVAALVIGLAVAAGSARAQTDGATLFARHCASCHGPQGEGDGPVATVMQATVPNLRTLRARSNGTFPRDAIMRYIDGRDLPAAHGERLMPVWGDTFVGTGADAQANEAQAREAIAAITDFIAELQR